MGDLTTQVHDFNPGIRQSGLFWTTRIGHDAVDVLDLDDARMHRTHMAVPDYHDFLNSISPSPKTRPGHDGLLDGRVGDGQDLLHTRRVPARGYCPRSCRRSEQMSSAARS